MVDVLGHLGMALVWAIPAWFLWESRVSAMFIGLVLVTAMLPDLDLVLRNFLPIVHHGITHTVVFVGVVSLVAAGITEALLRPWLERQWVKSEHYQISNWALFVFVAGAFLLGGLSHLFVDMLSAPDIAKPVEPFWPLFDKPWSIDLIWYNSPWWNAGLLLVASLLHLGLGYLDIQIEHPYQIERYRSSP